MFGKEMGASDALQMIRDKTTVAEARGKFNKKKKELLNGDREGIFRGPDDSTIVITDGKEFNPHISFRPLDPVVQEPTIRVAQHVIDVQFERKKSVIVRNNGLIRDNTGFMSTWPEINDSLPQQTELNEDEIERFEEIQRQTVRQDLKTVMDVLDTISPQDRINIHGHTSEERQKAPIINDEIKNLASSLLMHAELIDEDSVQGITLDDERVEIYKESVENVRGFESTVIEVEHEPLFDSGSHYVEKYVLREDDNILEYVRLNYSESDSPVGVRSAASIKKAEELLLILKTLQPTV